MGVFVSIHMYICLHECMYVGLVCIYVRSVFMRGERSRGSLGREGRRPARANEPMG